ncbi:MAG: nucleotidyltransferase family protein [Cytophagales bacterium]|nr:nucleotidyltransferase family protein [Cytophagales bacterium]
MPDSIHNTVIAILAAGASSRMGSHKALLDWNGQPLIVHAANIALEAGAADVAVITGAQYKAVQQAVAALPVQAVYSPHWQSGMAHSVATAAKWAHKQKAEGLLVMVCDQPFVNAELLRQILQKAAASAAPIIACTYANGTKGVPAWFDESFFEYLYQLKGDMGARKIIGQFADMVATVPFPEGEIDLDTPEQYHTWLRK